MNYREEIDKLVSEAVCNSESRDYEKAADNYRAAIVMALKRPVRDPRLAARLRSKLGRVLDAKGDYPDAEHVLARALVKLNHPDDQEIRADTLRNMGNVAWRRAPMAAEQYYLQAIDIYESLPGNQDENLAHSLRDLGLMQLELGNVSTATETLKRALALQSDNETSSLRVQTKRTLANAYNDIGRYHDAAALYREVLAASDEPRLRCQTLGSYAILHERTGNLGAAKAAYDEAISLVRRAGKPQADLISVLTNAATFFLDLGDRAYAQNLKERAYRRLNEDAPIRARIGYLIALSEMASRAGNKKQAIRNYRRLQNLIETELNPTHPNVASVRSLIGELLWSLEKRNEAIAEWQTAISTATNEAAGALIPVRIQLSAGLLQGGDSGKAEEIIRDAFLTETSRGVPDYRWRIFDTLADIAHSYNNCDAAIMFGKTAVNIVQHLSGGIAETNTDSADSYRYERLRPHKKLINRLVNAGRIPEAEHLQLIAQEVTLYDYTRRQPQLDPRWREVPQSQSETQLANEFDRLSHDWQHSIQPEENRVAGLKVSGTPMVEDHCEKATDWLDHALSEVWVQEGNKVENPPQTPAPTPSIATIRFIETDAALIISINAQSIQNVYEITGSPNYWNEQIHQFRQAILSTDNKAKEIGQKLFDELFGPIADELADVTELRIFAVGTLQYLPFAALHDGNAYFIDRWAVSFETAAKPVGGTGIDRKDWHAVGFGSTQENHGLPALSVADEFGLIQKTLRIETTLDENFTADAMQKALSKGPQIVHIASHFELNPAQSTRSRLLLGDGKFISLAEIQSPDYSFNGIELLVLSACNSGTYSPGSQGIESFAGLAQLKGARRVLGTLWPISDGSAVSLLPGFYEKLFGADQLSFAESLRLAQQALANGKHKKMQSALQRGLGSESQEYDYSHPYFWAGYVLFEN